MLSFVYCNQISLPKEIAFIGAFSSIEVVCRTYCLLIKQTNYFWTNFQWKVTAKQKQKQRQDKTKTKTKNTFLGKLGLVSSVSACQFTYDGTFWKQILGKLNKT